MLAFLINILSTPSILVGILALIGLILQKKPIEEIVKGTTKCIVGFLVLSAGASFLQSGSLLAFGDVFNYAFNMQGVVPNNEAIVSYALQDFGTETAYIMALGMILNIVLARFSRLKHIFPDRPPHTVHGSDDRSSLQDRRPFRTSALHRRRHDSGFHLRSISRILCTYNGKDRRD